MGWLAVEILFFGLPLLLIPSLGNNPFFRGFAMLALSYRLFDIFQAWVSQFILIGSWSPVDPHRSLVLVFVGYADIVFSYAIVAFLFKDAFTNDMLVFNHLLDSLRYSVGVLTTIGSGWEPVRGSVVGYAIFYTQITFGVLFITAVIQRIVSRVDGRDD